LKAGLCRPAGCENGGVLKFAVSAALALLTGGSLGAQSGPLPAGDLDVFMGRVLARRDENWKKLQQYVLDEREQVTVRGLGNVPIWGDVREYTWYVRDGFFVRSPVKANGVPVAEPDRRKYEEDYFRRVRARDERGRGGARPAAEQPATRTDDVQSFILQTRQPQFIDSAYFLKFRFEPSQYALVGRETFDGREVLRIEYYPKRLFRHEQDQEQRRRSQNETDTERDKRAAIERMLNRVSLVTLWVEPRTFQIVKYTFDNVNLEFLPAAWLLHMDDAKGVMTMAEVFPDVWLPRDVDMAIAATLAVGSFDVRYHLDYSNYRQAETSSRFKVSGEGQ
jgi:hypothetical protein